MWSPEQGEQFGVARSSLRSVSGQWAISYLGFLDLTWILVKWNSSEVIEVCLCVAGEDYMYRLKLLG